VPEAESSAEDAWRGEGEGTASNIHSAAVSERAGVSEWNTPLYDKLFITCGEVCTLWSASLRHDAVLQQLQLIYDNEIPAPRHAWSHVMHPSARAITSSSSSTAITAMRTIMSIMSIIIIIIIIIAVITL